MMKKKLTSISAETQPAGRKGAKDRRNWLPEREQDYRPWLPEDPKQDQRPWLPEHPTERRKWLLPNESGVRKEK